METLSPVDSRSCVLQIVLIVQLMLHMRWDPYVDRNLNTVELGLTVASLTLAQCGMVRTQSAPVRKRGFRRRKVADVIQKASYRVRCYGRFSLSLTVSAMNTQAMTTHLLCTSSPQAWLAATSQHSEPAPLTP